MGSMSAVCPYRCTGMITRVRGVSWSATVRFADIAEADFNLDPGTVADQLTPRTRVIMPVHLYGQTADMDPIVELAAARDLHVVEDAAQAHGARYNGRGAGSFGLGCFSLYATKNLTSGAVSYTHLRAHETDSYLVCR